MRKDFDVVILGGGPGGLAVGSLLARLGLEDIEQDVAKARR
jgi:2-polyprenyl-6-methoxyphenol hydroxylase-like FAD-dependent oxidoreductase